ncbi:ABC transporter ATP-binding protein [Micromonospora sp. NPDC126480]|uniref:ABC transporter ATP-binding protein n=1 Tax=Micromonospora sp. NPDC126480 TaxID=3155312 RepID=UPI00331C4D35
MADPNTLPANATTGAHGERIPTVIVDDVHLVYRVYGAGTGPASSPVAALKRIVTRQKQRPTLRKVHAVKGVSFTAYRGEAIGLIGSNGSGKSTLLRAIAGLMPPNQGAIYTQGQPSLLGVNAALLGDLSGERNAQLGCLAMGMSPEQTRKAVPEILSFSGINERGDFSSLPMRTYSSGMQARLRFSISAAKEHDVLLIDEALATGDTRFRRRSEQKIRQLRSNAGTVFLVSHSIGSIRDTCERSIWLESGEIRMDGRTDEVTRAYEEYMASR